MKLSKYQYSILPKDQDMQLKLGVENKILTKLLIRKKHSVLNEKSLFKNKNDQQNINKSKFTKIKTDINLIEK